MSINSDAIIVPDWPAPGRVKALVTTRAGGASRRPFDTFNLGFHVDDDPGAVSSNRKKLQQIIATQYSPQWLQQVHGTAVVEAVPDAGVCEGDAVFTRRSGLPCAVMTADCLPVFLCDSAGSQVAVAHAGWRGLAQGVLEATLATFKAPSKEILAWLGPAIGPAAFEVGCEVRDAFLHYSVESKQAFISNPDRTGYWFADLYMLARMRLVNEGLRQITGGDFCTFTDTERFYSYRRNKHTGRMASLIWLE